MDKKTLVIVLVAGALLAGGIFFAGRLFRSSRADSPEFPDGTHWRCRECNSAFHVTTEKMDKHHRDNWGDPYPCPKCRSVKVSRAFRCPHCETITSKIDGRAAKIMCPECGKEIPPPS